MKSRICDSFLTLLGMAGLMVYVLACGPAFSPDGTKVAFPVIDREARQTSIVVYDLKKKTFETLAVFAATQDTGSAKDAVLAYSVQWMPQGQRLLINGLSLVMILPVGSQGPARTLVLKEEQSSLPIMPPPVIGNYQYIHSTVSEREKDAKGEMIFVDKHTLLRVNLENWETNSIPIKPEGKLEGTLLRDGKQLCYIDKINNEGQTVYKIIGLNGDDGTQTVLLQLKEKECGELGGIVDFIHSGDRLAIGSMYQNEPYIVLIRGNSVEKMIRLGAKGSRMEIGNLAWSTDDKSLFGAFAKSLDDERNGQFGIIEVPLNGGDIRELPLFTGKIDSDGDGLIYFQIALSPDGRKIAASSLSLKSGALKPQDRVLYLVDISRPKWKVTKVPMPLPSASKAAVGKK